jgi:hypothetical protein
MKAAEKKPRHGVLECPYSMFVFYWKLDVGCSTCPQCLDNGVISIQPFNL